MSASACGSATAVPGSAASSTSILPSHSTATPPSTACRSWWRRRNASDARWLDDRYSLPLRCAVRLRRVACLAGALQRQLLGTDHSCDVEPVAPVGSVPGLGIRADLVFAGRVAAADAHAAHHE